MNCIAESSDLDADPPLEHANYVQINSKLRARLAISIWRKLVEMGAVEEWGLPQVLANSSARAVVQSFRSCQQFDDRELERVASALPRI